MPLILEQDLTPEQLYSLNEEILSLEPTFDSQRRAYAQALHDVGLTSKACRLDDCRRIHTTRRCAKGHETHTISACGLGTCPTCAGESAKNNAKDLEPFAFAFTSNTRLRMTYLEVHLPCAPDPESVRFVRDEATRTYLSLLPSGLSSYESKHAPKDTGITSYCGGFTEDGKLIFRILNIGYVHPRDGDHKKIKAAFPGCYSVVSTCNISELPKFYVFLLLPVIPKDPEAAARMELSFHRLRRVVTFGTWAAESYQEDVRVKQDAEIGVTEGGDITDIPAFESTKEEESHKNKSHSCPLCGSKIVSTSYMRLSDAITYSPPKRI